MSCKTVVVCLFVGWRCGSIECRANMCRWWRIYCEFSLSVLRLFHLNLVGCAFNKILPSLPFDAAGLVVICAFGDDDDHHLHHHHET